MDDSTYKFEDKDKKRSSLDTCSSTRSSSPSDNQSDQSQKERESNSSESDSEQSEIETSKGVSPIQKTQPQVRRKKNITNEMPVEVTRYSRTRKAGYSFALGLNHFIALRLGITGFISY